MKISLSKLALLSVFMLSLVSVQAESYQIDPSSRFNAQVKELQQRIPFSVHKAEFEKMSRHKRSVPHKIGDIEQFWTTNFVSDEFVRTDAVLKGMGTNCLIYVEKGKEVSEKALSKIQQSFDNNVYPVDRKYFGSEWKPGVDNDNRITLLLLDINDGYNGSGGYIAGYFYPVDQYTSAQLPANTGTKSNEREMMYLDISPANPEKEDYMGIVAHEFQHMIHFNLDPDELLWVNEACSQIAMYLCGFGHAPQIINYQWNPNNSLTAWSSYRMLANYGQVYLWNYYIINRFLKSDDKIMTFFKGLVASKKQGIKGYSEALEKISQGFSGVSRDFLFANHLNGSGFGKDFQYCYDNSLKDFKLPPAFNAAIFPAKFEGGVRLWGSEAINVDLTKAGSELMISFSGYLGTFMYDYENEFSVELVMQDSRGINPTVSKSMTIQRSIQRGTQGGTLRVENDGKYDSALLLMFASFPTEVDDFHYANSRPMSYKVEITDSGNPPMYLQQRIDLLELANQYIEIASQTENLPQDYRLMAGNQLDFLSCKMIWQYKNGLENNTENQFEALLSSIESGKIDRQKLLPVLKKMAEVASFSAEHSLKK